MTDWDQIVESINNAMQAVDKAHLASTKLREETNHQTLSEFRQHMEALENELEAMKEVFNHEDIHALDDIADVLSKYYGGKPSPYHHMPDIKIRE